MTPWEKDQLRREAIKEFLQGLGPSIGLKSVVITDHLFQFTYDHKTYILKSISAYSPKALGEFISDIKKKGTSDKAFTIKGGKR